MYINELEQNNIIYSVDKIRLKTFLTYSVFTEIEFRFKTCWSKYVKKYWTTPQLKQFFYNYDIEIEEGKSFWFGFSHNTERRSFYENAEYNSLYVADFPSNISAKLNLTLLSDTFVSFITLFQLSGFCPSPCKYKYFIYCCSSSCGDVPSQ